jgi:hypothetical protein
MAWNAMKLVSDLPPNSSASQVLARDAAVFGLRNSVAHGHKGVG